MANRPIGDDAARSRAEDGPCACSDALYSGCELLERARRGDNEHERLRCPCGVAFTRIWVAG